MRVFFKTFRFDALSVCWKTGWKRQRHFHQLCKAALTRALKWKLRYNRQGEWLQRQMLAQKGAKGSHENLSLNLGLIPWPAVEWDSIYLRRLNTFIHHAARPRVQRHPKGAKLSQFQEKLWVELSVITDFFLSICFICSCSSRVSVWKTTPCSPHKQPRTSPRDVGSTWLKNHLAPS